MYVRNADAFNWDDVLVLSPMFENLSIFGLEGYLFESF